MSTEDPSSSPLLSAKQAIPPVRGGLVPRARLEDRLATATTKLTAVVAPAGWGKTSLVSRWAQTAAGDARVAWFSVDPDDDEPVRFWSYVLASLRRVSDDISAAPVDALRASTDGALSRSLPLLLNELSEATSRHVLVLDDLHAVTHPEIHEGLEFLLAYLPPSLRLVIATRWDPPLPMARMRVRGELTEVRADDLRFSPDESASLVAAVSAAEVAPSVASSMWERTEGWAAGLQLAGLALRAGGDGTGSDAAVGAHHGRDDRHLFDYFAAEVFPALAERQRDLLVRAAPLELLSGSLCDAALDVEGSAAVLDELERADLFVVALDVGREWFRCHRLLRDALLRTSESSAGDAATPVLRRAAAWFADHGRFDDAVRHLLAAGDHVSAVELLRTQRAWFVGHGLAATYLAVGERLPDATVPADLAFNLAYAAELGGQRERGVRWLDLCDRLSDEGTAVDGWRSARAAALSLRSVMAVSPSEPARAVAMCEEAVALEAGPDPDELSIAHVSLARAYGFDGRFDEAVDLLDRFWYRRDQEEWWPGVDLLVATLLGLDQLLLGRVDEVDRVLAETNALIDASRAERGAPAAPVMMLLALLAGRRSHQRGDHDGAGAALRDGLQLADAASRPVFTVIGLLFLADHEVACGDRSAAQRCLVEAREIVDTEPVPPFVGTLLTDSEARIGRSAVRAASGPGGLVEPLTDREMSILRMLPGSASQREIGGALFLSINTVKAYNKSLYRKLGVGSRQDAVDAARRLGLI